jgi:CysZ protein
MFKELVSSVRAYGRALALVRELNLWGYVLIPVLISLVLAVGIGLTAWGISDNIGHLLTSWYPWEAGKGVVESIASVFGGLLVAALGFILYKTLVMILAGPFMSPLAEKVEDHLTGRKSGNPFTFPQFTSDLVRGIRIALRNVIRELSLTMLLLLLGLIPLFSPFVAILIFIVQSYYAGFGNMDLTLERHYRVRGSVDFVHRHRGIALGNGLVFMGILFTGIGFLFAPPLGTIAATVETVKHLDDVPLREESSLV